MATISQETRFTLDELERIDLADMRDHLLVCEAGELLITFADELRLIVIRMAERWRLDTAGAIVVTALVPSTLRLDHQQTLGPLAGNARQLPVGGRRWSFPPLAAFPVRLIR
jgi:hypothetical protein